MELLAALLLAGPLGYFVRTPRRALVSYLIVWAVIFPVQTVQVLGSSSGDEWFYWPVNAVILAIGVACNRLGARLGQRRRYVAA